MKRVGWLMIGVAVGVASVGVYWMTSRGDGEVVVDLVAELPKAKGRQPTPDVFAVKDVTIGGETKSSIVVQQPSRISYQVTVPENGWLDVSLGIEEEGWTRPGDGVLFFIGVSHAGSFDELLSSVVNPVANSSDRRWHSLLLDLSPYAGESVELRFNTRAGQTGDNREGDFAVWGAPRIVVR